MRKFYLHQDCRLFARGTLCSWSWRSWEEGLSSL